MKTECPHCGQHYDVDDAYVGKEAECTNCGKQFILQPAVALTVQTQQLPSSGACPYCGGEITSGVKKCRHCGEWIDRSAKPQNPIVYTLLALMLGGLGMHDFLNGQWCEGIGKILIFLTGLQIVHVWPRHPLGYIVFGVLAILILVDIVRFCRGTPPALKDPAKTIATVIAGLLLFAFLAYGTRYKIELGAVEASYAVSCYDPATCSEQEARLRMSRLMNWPLADSAEIRKAVHKGINDGMDIKSHMDARLHREKSSAPPVRF